MITEILVPTIPGTSIKIHKMSKSAANRIWDMHIHDECEFCMLIKKETIFYINNEEIVINEGDIIFVNENVPHSSKTFKDSLCFLLQCKNEKILSDAYANLSCFLNRNGKDYALFRKGTEINKLLRECFEEIAEENTKEKPNSDMFIKACVMKIYAILYRYEILKDTVCLFDEKSIKRIIPALKFTEEHYAENITLNDISKIMNVDKAHFCRIFKKATNTSYVQYLNFVRIEKAKKLLVETDKTVSEISNETGFSSPAYFSEIFKSVMNCTPSCYKSIKSSSNAYFL